MTQTRFPAARQPFAAIQPRRARLMILGVAMVALGLAAPLFPALTSIAAGVMAGWLLWFAGAVMLGLSLLLLPSWLQVGGAATSLLVVGAGIFLTFRPTTGALALALLLTAVFVADGSFQAVLALKLRPVKAWRWVLASAFASLVAGGIMATGALGPSPGEVGLVLALAFVTTGLGLIAVAATRAAEAD